MHTALNVDYASHATYMHMRILCLQFKIFFKLFCEHFISNLSSTNTLLLCSAELLAYRRLLQVHACAGMCLCGCAHSKQWQLIVPHTIATDKRQSSRVDSRVFWPNAVSGGQGYVGQADNNNTKVCLNACATRHVFVYSCCCHYY